MGERNEEIRGKVYKAANELRSSGFQQAYYNHKYAETRIQMYVTYMDVHLVLLGKALAKGNQGDIDVHKAKLVEIRAQLMALEYFSLA